jgi:hypothetical protein
MNAEQKRWWHRLQEIMQYEAQLDVAIRKLAIEIISAQPEQDRIVVAGQTLIRFGTGETFKTKKDYLDYHSRDAIWGDDPILYSVLNTLGYSPAIHLINTNLAPYIPFEQYNPTGLRINIVNNGAVHGGFHWYLKEAGTPGDGNCMYHTIAKQVEKDLPYVQGLISSNSPPAFVSQSKNGFFSHRTVSDAVIPQPSVSPVEVNDNISAPQQSTSHLTTDNFDKMSEAEIIAHFQSKDAQANENYYRAKTKLSSFTTQDLINAYHFAINNLVGEDTYLRNRPRYVTQEHGNNFIEQALKSSEIAKDSESLVREELLHMLAKEAWRNPKAYDALMSFKAQVKCGDNELIENISSVTRLVH